MATVETVIAVTPDAGRMIHETLKERGTPVTWLARRLNMSHVTLYHQLTGRRTLQPDVALRSAAILGIPAVLVTTSQPAA